MEKIFLFLYDIFRVRRRLFFTITALFILITAFLASRIKFEEDITKMLYGGDNTAILRDVVDQSKFLDKIIVNVTFTDTGYQPQPYELSSYADKLADTLLSDEFSEYVQTLTYTVNENITGQLFDIIYKNLPVFLEESDYRRLDSLTTPEGVKIMAENVYNNLLSPSGFAVKEMILRDPSSMSSSALGRMSSYQNDESYIIIDGRIFSRDGRNLLMFISPDHSSKETSENVRFIDMLNGAIAEVTKDSNPEIRIEYFGTVAVAAANADRLKKDIRLTLTITIILLSLIINFSIKKKKLFPFIFLPAVVGVLMALAAIYLIQGSMSVISLSIGTVIMAITVDYALHITTHFKHKHSVLQTIKDVSFPIIVCGFATAFEFISLLFVSSESLHELGLLAAISVITAAFFTMVVLPHILDVTKNISDETEEKNYLEKVLDRITNYNFHKKKLLLFFMFVYTVVAVFYARRVGFESDMMKMNYMTDELIRAEEHLNRINNYKLNSLYVVAYGSNLQEALVNNEKVLEQAEKFKNEGKIRSFSSPGSVLYSDSLQRMKIARWNEFWDQGGKEDFISGLNSEADALGFREGTFSEFGNMISKDFKTLDTADFNSLQELFFVDNISSTGDLTSVITTLKVEDESLDEVTRVFGNSEGALIIDRKSMLSGLVDTLADDFSLIANISLSLILVVLIVAFGRIELGVITFLPIFLSWVWTMGFMGITGIKFNIFNIIISSFITGLGIDYSIYIMQGLVQGYKTRDTNLLSYKTCILISVMISLAGTGVLILAKHPALNSIALISIVGLLSVVLISYTFEPLLFYWLVSKRDKMRVAPVTFQDIVFTVLAYSIAIASVLVLNLITIIVILLPFPRNNKKGFLHRVMAFFCKIPVYSMVHMRKHIINTTGEKFREPAVIISNHQSHIDLLLLLMLNPRIIALTNNWVWNNPVYGIVIRYLDYYPATEGYENLPDKLREKVSQGYSILVFPEGTRSADMKIKRFHKGAFLLAEKLGIDILPVFIHGAGDCMTKGENHIRQGSVTLKIYPRIRYSDRSFGSDYHERTKSVLAFYRKEYAILKAEIETPAYLRKKVISNYIFKGPVLEWYTRIKLSLENNYSLFDSLIPFDAVITDIGCGYGMMSYMLALRSERRIITGIDYDEDKIDLAGNCLAKNEKINFVAADVLEYELNQSDVFIVSDVLHYMSADKREKLLSACFGSLKTGGMVIIRDADRDISRKHLLTRYTEFFSTNFRFNKTTEKLDFFSKDEIFSLAGKYGMQAEIVSRNDHNSNVVYLIKHKG